MTSGLPKNRIHKGWFKKVKKRKNKIESNGRVWIHSPNHPNAPIDFFIPRARLKVEKYLERYLLKEEIIHHINKKPYDDRIKNLYITNKYEHGYLHKKDLIGKVVSNIKK